MTLQFHTRQQFFAANPCRRNSEQWDRGTWSIGNGRSVQLTWLEATGEVCAVVGSLGQESYAIVGVVDSYDLLRAALADSSEDSLEWAIRQIAALPTHEAEIAARVAAYRDRRTLEEGEVADREAASFEIVDLQELASTPIALADRYGEADWPRIARLAVDLFQRGLAPADHDAIASAATHQLTDGDAAFLVSLFADPIVVRPGRPFTNGRHRVAAMRAAGVSRCVVHTYRGWPDDALDLPSR